jgi:hypothetical protein
MFSITKFCYLYEQMRDAQNNYFASKKGTRVPTKESKELLAIAKKLEAELDEFVKECKEGIEIEKIGGILNELESQMFKEGTFEEKEVTNE